MGPTQPLPLFSTKNSGGRGVKSQLFDDDDESRQTKMGDGFHKKIQLDSLSDDQEIKYYELEGDC